MMISYNVHVKILHIPHIRYNTLYVVEIPESEFFQIFTILWSNLANTSQQTL